jgi:hypothetical protein
VQRRSAFRLGHVRQVRRVAAIDVKRLPAGLRVGAHDGLLADVAVELPNHTSAEWKPAEY